MYNLLITVEEDAWLSSSYVLPLERFLEHTSDDLRARFKELTPEVIAELRSLPSLFAYEKGIEGAARLGRITSITPQGRAVRIGFKLDRPFDLALSPKALAEHREELGITQYELHRTHWAVKDIDLHHALELIARLSASQPQPGVRSTSAATREPPRGSRSEAAPVVFISNSPGDAAIRDMLVTHLRPRERAGALQTWDEGRIRAGADRKEEIRGAIERAKVAVVLVSAEYLADDFIHEVVLDQLLERRQKGGLRLVPILARPCDLSSVAWLRSALVLPSHKAALSQRSPHEIDVDLAHVAQEIRELLSDPTRIVSGPSSPSMGALAPRYASGEIRSLSDQLEAARARRSALQRRGLRTDVVDQEILGLRRQIREGGQLREGDYLDDGRYLLIEVLGKGGFGVVWKAHDRDRDELVAVKVLRSDIVGDTARRDRFFRGARAMGELEHEAVVRVLSSYGEDGGYYYFVMELIGGPTLYEAVRSGQLAKADVLPLILKVGDALSMAHAKGMVHRDIKPANILLDAQGSPKLTDFDLVQAADTTGGTRTGALGTFLYAAPELLDRPQDAGARADVFSLGMTAIFAFYGRDLPKSVFRGVEPVLDQIDCEDGVKAVLKRAVDWDEGARFEDAAELCQALRSALAE